MKFLDELRDEHASISTMLCVLEACATRLESGRRLQPEVLEGVLDYFRSFVLGSHQAKEERALFPLLVARGANPQIVRQLEAQHRTAQAVLEGLAGIAADLGRGRVELRGPFAREVHRFTAAEREHQRAKLAWIMTTSAALLNQADDEALVADFARIDCQAIGPTGREWFRQVVADYRSIASTWGSWVDLPR